MSNKIKNALILDENIALPMSDSDVCWYSSTQDWFFIENGIWVMSQGIIWDGATGVPDGDEDPNKPGYPKLWLASLVHDLGLAFLEEELPHTKKEIDKMFLVLMKRAGFKWRWVYYIGVRTFGTIWSHIFDFIQDKFHLERKLPSHISEYNKLRSMFLNTK